MFPYKSPRKQENAMPIYPMDAPKKNGLKKYRVAVSYAENLLVFAVLIRVADCYAVFFQPIFLGGIHRIYWHGVLLISGGFVGENRKKAKSAKKR